MINVHQKRIIFVIIKHNNSDACVQIATGLSISMFCKNNGEILGRHEYVFLLELYGWQSPCLAVPSQTFVLFILLLSIFETAFEEIVTHANLRLWTFAQCKYKMKRCSHNENNVDMSSLRAPWQNGPYKKQHTKRHKNTYNIMTQQTIRKTISLCFSDFSKPTYLYVT